MKNMFRNTSSQVIKQSAKAYLKENIFLKNYTDLDVKTFNYDNLPKILYESKANQKPNN